MKARRGLPAALATLAILPLLAHAQTGGPYSLTWSTIDGGGATFLAGGAYSLGCTAGQPDAGAAAGGSYALSGGFWTGGNVPTAVDDDPAVSLVPAALLIRPSAPNPFARTTTTMLELPVPSRVLVRVYNLAGQLVRTLADEMRPAGHHEVEWDGTDGAGRRLARGVYLLRARAGSLVHTQKLVLVN